MKVLIHDDDCGAPLDSVGKCPKCKFIPDMQSTAFVEPPRNPPNPLKDYWDALDAWYRSIGMTDDDAYDDFRERNRG